MTGSAEGEDASGLAVQDSIAVVHVEGETPAGRVEGTIQDRSITGAGGSCDRDRQLDLPVESSTRFRAAGPLVLWVTRSQPSGLTTDSG